MCKGAIEEHFEVSYETVSSNFSDVLHRRIVPSCRMRIAAVAASKAARASHAAAYIMISIPRVQIQNEAGLVRMRQH